MISGMSTNVKLNPKSVLGLRLTAWTLVRLKDLRLRIKLLRSLAIRNDASRELMDLVNTTL